MAGRVEGKVVLVSGAARGIGEAAARRLAEEGAVLWVCDILEEVLAVTVESIAATGATITGTVGDASDPAFVDSWVQGAIDAHGRIDVLYNNVGVSRPGLVAETSDDDWRFQQRMTLDTVFYATRAVLPHMVAQGRGSIISMSSGAGIGGEFNLGGYAAAKAGVINLMETVSTEYGRFGVRANSVTPGPTETQPMRDYVLERPGLVEALTEGLDLHRLSQPFEVANTILWLASDDSSIITGNCVRNNIRSGSTRT